MSDVSPAALVGYSPAERVRAAVMRLYAQRLKRIQDIGDPRRAQLLRTLVFLDSARGRELVGLIYDHGLEEYPMPRCGASSEGCIK
jgi:hypothetical protein